jgi:hypothetical protein
MQDVVWERGDVLAKQGRFVHGTALFYFLETYVL